LVDLFDENANGPIDWNCNSFRGEGIVSFDANGNGMIDTALTDFDDWANIKLNVGMIGALGAVILPSATPSEPPLPLDGIAPTTTATVDPAANTNGWHRSAVTVTLTAFDDPDGSGVRSITYSATGAEVIPSTTITGDSASFVVSTEGITTITFAATDIAGNVEALKSLTIRIDVTPPTCTCTATPDRLLRPDHQLVPVTVSVEVSDAGSGAAGFTLLSVTSNEPDNGLGDGDQPNDIQGFEPGTADTTGKLRAERSGVGSGRIYTMIYEAADLAGNTSSCSTTVVVPLAMQP
jgi:hypothetical protein